MILIPRLRGAYLQRRNRQDEMHALHTASTGFPYADFWQSSRKWIAMFWDCQAPISYSKYNFRTLKATAKIVKGFYDKTLVPIATRRECDYNIIIIL